ncbi:MAG: serine/threonine-protein kinase, partial [Planctomycetota bacterium]
MSESSLHDQPTPTPFPRREPSDYPDRDALLDRIAEDYMDAEDQGRRPSVERLLEIYPELESELRAFLRGVGALSDASIAPPSSGAIPALGGFGDYELLEELGRGGMGVVFRARHSELGREVALKTLTGSRGVSGEARDRFDREIRAASSLDHPNIATVLEAGEVDGERYYTMKLVTGGDLAHRQGELREDPRRIARVLETVARAVHAAHFAGVFHRDLKPANILLDEELRPYVSDFGLSKALDSDQHTLTQTGALLGTPAYMPPEIAAGRRVIPSAAQDIYSLGVILFELLTGELPFRSETSLELLHAIVHATPRPISQFRAQVPRDLETICLKCLEKDPQKRYRNASDLADDLGRFLGNRPVEARRVGLVGRTTRWCRRNRAATAVLVLLFALLSGAVTAAILLQSSEQRAQKNAKDARESLWQASYEQALSAKYSVEAGRRVNSLRALKTAAEIRPSVELRDAAIACLSTGDAELVSTAEVFAGEECMSLSPDQQLYLTRSEDLPARVRRVSDHSLVITLNDARDGDRAVRPRRFFPSSSRYVAASVLGRKPIRQAIWDLEHGPDPIWSDSCTNAIDLGSNGTIAVPRKDGIWIASIHRPTDDPEFLCSERPGSLVLLSPDATRVAATSTSRSATAQLEVLDVATKRVLFGIPFRPASRQAIAWHPSGGFIAVADDLRVHFVDSETGVRLASLPESGKSTPFKLLFTPDGEHLLALWGNRVPRIYETASRALLAELPSHFDDRSFLFSTDGNLLGTTEWYRKMETWR